MLGIIAGLWAIQSVRAAIGLRKLPRVERFEPLPAEECPKVSIIFGALNEAAELPSSLPTMLALDYPDYELIAVDDRSTDDTGGILDDFAARNPRLKVVHITELPPGWLGKPHALHTGSKIATASWLVFTDADVHFAADSLRRIVAVAIEQKLDHLALMTKMIMLGFWEHVVMTFFGLGFALGEEAWRTSDPRSSRYIGIGAFNPNYVIVDNDLDCESSIEICYIKHISAKTPLPHPVKRGLERVLCRTFGRRAFGGHCSIHSESSVVTSAKDESGLRAKWFFRGFSRPIDQSK